MAKRNLIEGEDILTGIEFRDVAEGTRIPGEVREGTNGILSGEKEQELKDLLKEEFPAAKAEKQERLDKIEKLRRHLDNELEHKVKDYPYPNASNLSVPITSSIHKIAFGYLHKMYGNREPLVVAHSPKEEHDFKTQEDMELLTKVLTVLTKSKQDLNWQETGKLIEKELTGLGNAFVYVPWEVKRWTYKEVRPDGLVEEKEMLLKDGPEFKLIREEDILYRNGIKDIQSATWVGFRFSLHKWTIKNMVTEGVWDEDQAEQVLQHPRSVQHPHEQEDSMQNTTEDIYDLWYVWTYIDADDDGKYEDIEFIYHEESEEIINPQYNSYGLRSLSIIPFWNKPFSILGEGIAKQTEYSQDEGDMLHNSRIDNIKYAVNKMVFAKRGAIHPHTRLSPGAIIDVNGDLSQVRESNFGSIDMSSQYAENMAIQYAQKNSGISDAMGGFADSVIKSGDTSSGQAFRQRQGQGIFSSIAESVGNGISILYLFVLLHLVKNREHFIELERAKGRFTEDELSRLDEILTMDLADVPQKIWFSISTSDAEETYESERQNVMTLFTLHSTFYEKMIPLAMQLGKQDILEKAFTSSCRIMDRIYKFFGEENTQKLIPEYKKMEAMKELRDAMQQAGIPMEGGQNVQGQGQGQAVGPGQAPGQGPPQGGAGQPSPGMGQPVPGGPGGVVPGR